MAAVSGRQRSFVSSTTEKGHVAPRHSPALAGLSDDRSGPRRPRLPSSATTRQGRRKDRGDDSGEEAQKVEDRGRETAAAAGVARLGPSDATAAATSR